MQRVQGNCCQHVRTSERGSRCSETEAGPCRAEVWTARLEKESEDLPEADADTGRVPSAAQVGKDIETTGALLKEFWWYCVSLTGTVETTASGYSRYVR